MTYDYGFADPVVVGATKAFAEGLTRYVRLDNYAVAVLQKLHRRHKLGLVFNLGILECGRELGKIRPSRVF